MTTRGRLTMKELHITILDLNPRNPGALKPIDLLLMRNLKIFFVKKAFTIEVSYQSRLLKFLIQIILGSFEGWSFISIPMMEITDKMIYCITYDPILCHIFSPKSTDNRKQIVFFKPPLLKSF